MPYHAPGVHDCGAIAQVLRPKNEGVSAAEGEMIDHLLGKIHNVDCLPFL